MEMTLSEVTRDDRFERQQGTWDDFTINFVKSLKAPAGAEFLPSEVMKGGTCIWSFNGFKKDHASYPGFAKLVNFEDEYFIVFEAWRTLDYVFPIRDLPHLIRTSDGEYIGGRNIAEIVRIKRRLAGDRKLTATFTLLEQKFAEKVKAQRREEDSRAAQEAWEKRQEERRAAIEVKRAQRREEREQLKALVLARGEIVVFTKSGERRTGYPVVVGTDAEWMALGYNTRCIFVSSYDDKTKEHGDVSEWFIVSFRDGKPVRVAAKEVAANDPKKVNTSADIITVNGVLTPIVTVESIDDVKKLLENGLNSGTLVTCPSADKQGKLYFRLAGGKMKQVSLKAVTS